MAQRVTKAAALAYNAAKHTAPKVVASGRGEVAMRIIAKAKEYEVPLFCNEALVDSLLDTPLDSQIAPELYMAVARVFAWIERCEQSAQLSEKE